jgi:sortase B
MEQNIVYEIGASFVKAVDILLNIVSTLLILCVFGYSLFCLIDNNMTYQKASSHNYQTYKPLNSESLSFIDYAKGNGDIAGWLTLDNTGVDYPLVHGNDQFYLDHDASRNTALTGSLFLTRHNNPDFSDFNSIIYGHHMEKGQMFGDLDKYLEKDFFENNKSGKIFYDSERKNDENYNENGAWAWHELEIVAVAECKADDKAWYTPGLTSDEAKADYLDLIRSKSKFVRQDALEMGARYLEMSTCKADETNGRTVVIAKILD